MKKKREIVAPAASQIEAPTGRQLSKVAQESASSLLANLRSVILEARRQAISTVDVVQVRTCWFVGRHIVEFEQAGQNRAAYGKGVLAHVSAQLATEFGRGFDRSNLYKMSQFYRTFPNLDALRLNLSWTHYRLLLRVDSAAAREWYMNEAATQNWNTRALERQIGTLYYERLLASKDRQAVRDEAAAKLAEIQATPREFIRDPVMLEFLGLPGTGKLLESKLEHALIDNLQAFLLELGKGFAFVDRQQRISTETKDFYIDLVFYNYLLKCFVLFDLKTRELTHEDIGQMDMYVRLYDDQRRSPDDGPTVGIIRKSTSYPEDATTRSPISSSPRARSTSPSATKTRRSISTNWRSNARAAQRNTAASPSTLKWRPTSAPIASRNHSSMAKSPTTKPSSANAVNSWHRKSKPGFNRCNMSAAKFQNLKGATR